MYVGIPRCLHDRQFLLQLCNLLIHQLDIGDLRFGCVTQLLGVVVFAVDGQCGYSVSPIAV